MAPHPSDRTSDQLSTDHLATDRPATAGRTATRRHPGRALVSLLLAVPLTGGLGLAVAHATGAGGVGTTAVAQPAAPAAPGTTGTPSVDDLLAVFYDAGYTFDDAGLIAAAWQVDVGDAKVLAGQKLDQGLTLPVAPSGLPGLAVGVSLDEAVAEYLAAGYTTDDAAALAEVWSGTPAADVKATAGEKLLLGLELPVQPSGDPGVPGETSVDRFLAAGYDYADAEELAALWQLDTPYDAKVLAGEKLARGEDLPVVP